MLEPLLLLVSPQTNVAKMDNPDLSAAAHKSPALDLSDRLIRRWMHWLQTHIGMKRTAQNVIDIVKWHAHGPGYLCHILAA